MPERRTASFDGPSRPSRGVRWKHALLAAGLLIAAGSDTARAESLTEALALTYQNNPALLAARAELRSVDENVPQALSGWRPTVTLEATTGLERTDFRSDFATDGTQTPRSYTATITQPIYQGGQTSANTEQAENQVLAQRAALLLIEQQVLFSAVTAYADVVRDTAVLDLRINNESRLQRQLQAARDRFAVGEITRTDVAQAESRLAGARAERRQAEGDLATSRAVYQEIVGRAPGELADPPRVEGLPQTLDQTIELAETSNPEVLQSIYTERAAVAGVRSVTGQLLPSVSVQGQVQRLRDFSTSSDQTSYSVTAQVSVPLYQAGAVTSRIRQQRQVASQRRIQIEQSLRSARETAIEAWESLASARAQIISRRAEVQAQQIAYEGVQQEATVGSRTVLDVLDAEQELLSAQVALVQQQRDEVVAEFALLSASGLLNAVDLGLPVDAYDVEKYYRRVRNLWWGLE